MQVECIVVDRNREVKPSPNTKASSLDLFNFFEIAVVVAARVEFYIFFLTELLFGVDVQDLGDGGKVFNILLHECFES